MSWSLDPLPRERQRTYQRLLEWSHEQGMPGAILLVRTPDREFLAAVGMADLQRRIPMRPNHLFQVASVTKSFIGVVAAQMHCEGTLDLNARISNWLSDRITDRFEHADRITVRHLLEHTSGIHEPRNDFWYPLTRNFVSRRANGR